MELKTIENTGPAQQSSPSPEERVLVEDHFGLCPDCGCCVGPFNVERAHWMVCHIHGVKWFAGENLFRSWRSETTEDWARNCELLNTYREVEPVASKSVSKARHAIASLVNYEWLSESRQQGRYPSEWLTTIAQWLQGISSPAVHGHETTNSSGEDWETVD